MKILCINHEYPPVGGGGATVCETLAEAMAKNGNQVDIVTSGMADLPPREVRNGVTIYRVRCVRRKRYYSTTPELLTQIRPAYRKALELHRKNQYDINHTHFIVPSGVTSYFLKRATGLPYVLTAHGSDVPGYNPNRFELVHRLIGPLWRRIIDNCDACTSPSRFLRELLTRSIDVDVTVIPNNYDPPSGTQHLRKDCILVASRLVERKGIQFLFAALDAVKPGWKVCIAGDGPYLDRLRELAARSPVPIEFLGFTPRETLKELYSSAKIFVFPSLKENFPMVLLEAMAGGCAVVTSLADGCGEVVGDAAIRIQPRDTTQFREVLSRLTHDESEIARYRERGMERVQQFSSSHIAGLYETLFAGVVAEQKNTRRP
ncbi:MAG TPA: glycosyltransferase family 1 protein [Gammaproteobacteria bacterium]|nr:glycosyltransferase family 1 protein [Gammaproteobacteria bacterium]